MKFLLLFCLILVSKTIYALPNSITDKKVDGLITYVNGKTEEVTLLLPISKKGVVKYKKLYYALYIVDDNGRAKLINKKEVFEYKFLLDGELHIMRPLKNCPFNYLRLRSESVINTYYYNHYSDNHYQYLSKSLFMQKRNGDYIIVDSHVLRINKKMRNFFSDCPEAQSLLSSSRYFTGLALDRYILAYKRNCYKEESPK